jgi:hypothetical protein
MNQGLDDPPISGWVAWCVWCCTHRSGGGLPVELNQAARLGPFRRHGGVCHPFASSEQKEATMSMARMIVGGVDTRPDTHVAAVIDANGWDTRNRVVPT